MEQITIPRRRVSRFLIKNLIHAAFRIFTDFELIGAEYIPDKGPIIITANHFSFADSVAMLRIAPPSIELFAGANPAFTPGWAKMLPKLWGVLRVYRGTGSRKAIRAAESVLKQGGFFGIFPEGGAWANVLRPPRPGAAYLAARTNTQILPVGFYGFNDLFPLRLRNRPKVTIKVGKPFGPFFTSGRGRERRAQLDRIGHQIMEKIAEQLPAESRGYYSDDPELREAAREAALYPWDHANWDEV